MRILIAVLALIAAVVAQGATWPIELDGKKVDAPWYGLSESPDTLAVGDVLY